MGGFTLGWMMTSVVLLGHLATIDGKLKPNDCSMVQYGAAVSACWIPYSMDLASGTEDPNKPFDFKINFLRTCGVTPQSNPSILSNAFKCHAEVDDTCGFRMIDTVRAEAAVSYICNNYDDILDGGVDLGKCFDASVFAVGGCVEKFKYAGDICGLTNNLRQCLKTATQTCGKFQDLFDKAVHAVMLEKCAGVAKVNKNKQCTAIGSFAAMGMCSARFIVKLIKDADKQDQVKINFDTMCKDNTDDVLKAMLDCYDDVQTECGTSFVNIAELRAVKDQACTIVNDFTNFGTCMKGTTVFPCLNKITIDPSASGYLCTMTNTDFRPCLLDIFKSCANNLKSFMGKVIDTTLLPCPHTSNSVCSIVEHSTTHIMCWYTSLQTLVPWTEIYAGTQVNFNPKTQFQALCATNRNLVENSIKCHEDADERCEWVTMRGDFIKKLYNAFCEDLDVFFSVGQCVDGEATRKMFSCALAAKNINPTAGGAYCVVLSHMKQCMNSMFDKCGQDIQDKFDNIYDIYVSNVCDVTAPSGADNRYPTVVVMVASLVLGMLYAI